MFKKHIEKSKEYAILKTIHLEASDVNFSAQEKQTILEAALANDINLEYSCSNGRCGKCKAQLIKGTVDHIDSSFCEALSENEILTCRSIPSEDLIIKANYFPELAHIKRKTLPSKVDSFSLVSPDVITLVLRIPETANFDFLSGQYIDLTLRGSKRSYSIASARVLDNKFELHIKKVENGLFSNFLFSDLKVGQLIRFHGPLGTFFLKDNKSPIIFLCTGTGFAPVKSIIENLIESGSTRGAYIYWGGRTAEDLYSSLPEEWAQQYKHIKYIPVLSRAAAKAKVKYVQNVVIEHHQNLSEFEVYACGSENMIQDAKQLLISNGLKSENFYSDAFVPSD
tara:strand:+ start:80 stop:1096 length:1017 start_codon:yes stop_codon:yes gene_type:complete